LVSANQASPLGRTNAGELYLIYGSSSLPSTISLSTYSTPFLTMEGDLINSGAGFRLSPAGDFNGDTYPDFVVVAPFGMPALTYIVYGKASFVGTLDLRSFSATDGVVLQGGDSDFGFQCNNAQDVNQDGYSDFLIGDLSERYNGRIDSGAAYLLYGGPNIPAVVDFTAATVSTPYSRFEGAVTADFFGTSVAGLGDVNGDGVPDVIIGAPGANTAGYAYLFFGIPSPTPSNSFTPSNTPSISPSVSSTLSASLTASSNPTKTVSRPRSKKPSSRPHRAKGSVGHQPSNSTALPIGPVLATAMALMWALKFRY